jgi:hypothetical protein
MSAVTKDDIDKLTLQIGVLMGAVTAITRKLGANDAAFCQSVRSTMDRAIDMMLSRGVSDAALDLAQGTIDTILSGLPPA